jgi:hypothetical protein
MRPVVRYFSGFQSGAPKGQEGSEDCGRRSEFKSEQAAKLGQPALWTVRLSRSKIKIKVSNQLA